MRTYELIGTPEVWFLYPSSSRVEVFYLREGRLIFQRTVSSGELRPQIGTEGIRVEELWDAFYKRKI